MTNTATPSPTLTPNLTNTVTPTATHTLVPPHLSGIGIYNPADGRWYLRDTPSAGSPNWLAQYGGMTANEAKEYGIVDEVLEPNKIGVPGGDGVTALAGSKTNGATRS